MASISLASGVVLNSWKEIANHLGRGVRTVQRWERDLGMPVRRPRAKSRSAVIAMADEIDSWLRSAPTGELTQHREEQVTMRVTHPGEIIIRLRQAMQAHEDLRDRCFQLRAENKEALATLVANIRNLHKSLVDSQQSENAAD